RTRVIGINAEDEAYPDWAGQRTPQNLHSTPLQIDDAWIEQHYPRVHRTAWLLTGDAWEAEDLTQETFLAAFESAHQFRHQSLPSTWLHSILLGITRRRFRSRVRATRRIARYVRNQIRSQPIDPATAFAEQQWRDSVWCDVAKLPTPQRLALTLRYGDEMSYEDIASILKCKVGTAKTRVHHGIAKLRRLSPDPMPVEPTSGQPVVSSVPLAACSLTSER
ncbi:MAG: RNA polymerase sigma factor, partial [Planctomycetota bacterium]